MTASYPGAIRTWTTRLDFKHIVWAAQVNDLQNELGAAQATLGLMPHTARRNPGGLSRDYPDIEARLTAHARDEDTPFVRAAAERVSTTAGAWQPITLTGAADPYVMLDAGAVVINQTGLWVIEARTEWQATGYTLTGKAGRNLRICIDGADVGLADHVAEDSRNSFALHNQIVWQEPLAQGARLSVEVRTDVDAPVDHPLPVNVNFRAYLVRCLDALPASGLLTKVS
jgi:hypothetical protein